MLLQKGSKIEQQMKPVIPTEKKDDKKQQLPPFFINNAKPKQAIEQVPIVPVLDQKALLGGKDFDRIVGIVKSSVDGKPVPRSSKVEPLQIIREEETPIDN